MSPDYHHGGKENDIRLTGGTGYRCLAALGTVGDRPPAVSWTQQIKDRTHHFPFAVF